MLIEFWRLESTTRKVIHRRPFRRQKLASRKRFQLLSESKGERDFPERAEFSFPARNAASTQPGRKLPPRFKWILLTLDPPIRLPGQTAAGGRTSLGEFRYRPRYPPSAHPRDVMAGARQRVSRGQTGCPFLPFFPEEAYTAGLHS